MTPVHKGVLYAYTSAATQHVFDIEIKTIRIAIQLIYLFVHAESYNEIHVPRGIKSNGEDECVYSAAPAVSRADDNH